VSVCHPDPGRGGPRDEGGPEDSVPEPAGAIGIVGRELDQWRGHGRSMAGGSRSLLSRASSAGAEMIVSAVGRDDGGVGVI